MGRKKEKLICFDFDGVIHSFTSGWKGADIIPDPPVTGAKQIIESLICTPGVRVCIFSGRNLSFKGRRAVRKYLVEKVGINSSIVKLIKLPIFKPMAVVMLDDRGMLFEGKFPAVSDLINFKSWTEKVAVIPVTSGLLAVAQLLVLFLCRFIHIAEDTAVFR